MNNNISVVINSFNEEKNIRNCLESVKWADEIVIVDMYSEDKTFEIASQYTKKIYLHERMGFADPARQFAIEKATNKWILVVDADEVIPSKLKEHLIDIKENNNYDAVWIPRKNYFFGKALKATGWGPLQDKQLRFYKKKYMTYSDRIHNFVNLDDEARVLTIKDENLNIIHFNYLSVEHFINKLNRYTTIEARQMKFRKDPTISTLLLTCLKEFFKRFILKKGYKDGFLGFSLSILMVGYKVSSLLKYKVSLENKSVNTHDSVYKIYQALAQEIIKK